jgi:hypothetical protein
MRSRWKPFQLFALFGLAFLLEPFGHQIAYLVRFGIAQAQYRQAGGSHAYFPKAATVSLGLTMLLLLGALAAALLVRLALGDRNRQIQPGWNWRAFFFVLTVQSGVFLIQESLEAASVQASPDYLLIGVLALVGQLPVTLAASWLVAQLKGYIQLAPEAIRVILALRLARDPKPILVLRNAPALFAPVITGQPCHPRRGPPQLSF